MSCMEKSLFEDLIASVVSYLVIESKAIGSRNSESNRDDIRRERIISKERNIDKRNFSRRNRDRLKKATSELKELQNNFLSVFHSHITRFEDSAEEYKRGTLSSRVKKFKDLISAELKDVYYKAYTLGLNSTGAAVRLEKSHRLKDVDPGKYHQPILSKDTHWVNSAIREETKFLFAFIDDIANKKGTMPYYKRASMYADAVSNIFNSGRLQGIPKGNTLIYWRTSGKDTICKSCDFLHKNSPYTKDTIPTMPRSGHTKCLTNCHCRVEYRNVSSSAYLKRRRRLLSRSYYTKKLKSLKGK